MLSFKKMEEAFERSCGYINGKRIADHWNEDRDAEMTFDYANDTLVTAAMKLWLGIPEETPVNEMNLGELFDQIKDDTALKIIEEYIEATDREEDFDLWYEVKYNEDAEDDWDGMSDDEIDFPIWGTAGRCEL